MAKFDIYQMVTDRFIAELEKGNIPWQRPWTGVKDGAFNRITKKPYSLLNQMLLEEPGEYATFKQWKELGGHIKKGAEGKFIVFWKQNVKTVTNEDGEEETKRYWMLRYYNVFHISDVEGVEPLNKEKLNTEIESLPDADELIEAYVERSGIKFEPKISNKAYYSPMLDTVVVPCKEQYSAIEEYYSTTFHELTHSTGAKTRLNRLTDTKNAAFGSEDYSKEELVAEIGSATILSLLGIDTPKTFKNSAAYLQSWLQVLKNDNHFIISATAKAKEAVNYIFDTEVIC